MHRLPHARTVASQRALLSALLSRLAQWRSNLHGRRQLALLGERELADAGIDNCQRAAELDKAFWR